MRDAETAYEHIVEQQQRWAEQRRVELDESGHLVDAADNFFTPPREETRRALQRRHAQPFEGGDKPGPIHALHSTEALACSVFEPWSGRAESPIDALLAPHAPGSDRDASATEITFAASLETCVAGVGTEADVLLRRAGDRPTAVISCFTEGYADIDTRMRDELARHEDLLRDLPGCRALRDDLRANPRRMSRTPVGRILELAGALHHSHGPRGARIVHLWFDSAGRAARTLRHEADRLRMRIGGEVDFTSVSWQSLFLGMMDHPESEPGQIEYLAQRYFGH